MTNQPSDPVQIKVIEVQANQLVPGATYLITIDPMFANYILEFQQALHELNIEAIVLPVPKDTMGVWSIVP